MSSHNAVIEVGRLTSDPRKLEGDTEHSVAFFALAVGHRYRDKAGEVKEETHYFDVVCFGGQADSVMRVLKKGWLVLVDGRLQMHRHACDCGKKTNKISIAAKEVKFLAAPHKNPEGQDQGSC